jgi:hypothetical protein
MKFTITFLIIIFFISSEAECQVLASEETTNEEIKTLLLSETGTNYYVNSFDVNLRKFGNQYLIQDKYELLADCFVFTAKDSTNNSAIIFGIFKNGNIIWNSRSFFIGESIIYAGGDVWQIRNLKPNLVYTIFQLPYSPNGAECNIWVMSWNGAIGNIVNEIDQDDFSEIISIPNSIEVIDIDGDGKQEIVGVIIDSVSYDEQIDDFVNKTKETVYSWNGEILGDFGVVRPATIPMDKLEVIVNANVQKGNEIFNYEYQLYNNEISLQSIQNFSIATDVDTIFNGLAPSKWLLINSNLSLILFSTDPYYSDDMDSKILPGKEENRFKFSSFLLPKIVKYYIQGFNGGLSTLNDIKSNSKSGYTIGPVEIVDTLISVNFLDTLISYNNQSFVLGWLLDSLTENKYANYFTTAKAQLQQNNIRAARTTLQTVLQEVDIDSTNNLTSEAYALLKYNTEYLLKQIPEQPNNPNLVVNLKNSLGNQIPASNVMYYEGSWKDAVNNGDGTFTVVTTRPTVSIRVFYEYASQQVDNVPAHNNTYTFKTVNSAVQLKNSLENLIDQGTVQYYAGAWRSFGTTTNGVTTKELLPINYSFRMTYEFASIDKQQNLSVDPTVVFQTVNAAVQLKNSLGNLIDQGTVQYYAGAWRSFGTTTNGVATKELLPINYSFRMTYEYASIDKQQNLSSDPTVIFQTVNVAVQLKNSLGNLIDVGTVQYYAGAWRSFGTTTNGVTTKELLPINYSFRMMHEFLSKDKQHNLSTSNVVDFQTVLCTVKVTNSTNQALNNANVKYYAGAWRNFGVTNTEGITTKELLPQNISFRASYGSASLDKQQDIGVNSLVEILLNVP